MIQRVEAVEGQSSGGASPKRYTPSDNCLFDSGVSKWLAPRYGTYRVAHPSRLAATLEDRRVEAHLIVCRFLSFVFDL